MNFIFKEIAAGLRVFPVIGLIILVCPLFAYSQAPSLKTGTDKNLILIGEHFTLSIQASFPQDGFSITMANVPDSFDHFEVVERKKIDTSFNNGMITCTQNIILTSFDSGRHSIPPLPINFDPYRDDTTFNVYTDSIPMQISYSPADTVKTFHDIKPIIGVKDEIPLWIWIAGGALLILLIIITWYLLTRKKKVKPAVIFDSKLTPYNEAMESLEKLKALSLPEKGELKQFHSALSSIFKRYASRKQKVNLSGVTTSELLVKLDATTLEQNKFTALANALRVGDAAKFAKYIPAPEQNELCFSVVKNTITEMNRETKIASA